METKYYVPTRDEFHEGFEYEAFILERNSWSLEIFYLNDSHLNLIKNNKIRAKYLEIEDLTSLGFNFDPSASDEDRFNCEKSGNKVLPGTIGITVFDDTRTIFYHYVSDKEHILFNGIIKNKSELKRLLKQLRINENNN